MSNDEKLESGQNEKPPQIDLDEILVNEVGSFGRYQIIMVLLAAFPVIFSAFAAGEYIFTTARIPTRYFFNVFFKLQI